MEVLIILFVVAVFLAAIPGGIGAMILTNKGRSGWLGFALGFFLSWIGWIICLLLSPSIEHEAARNAAVQQAMRRGN